MVVFFTAAPMLQRHIEENASAGRGTMIQASLPWNEKVRLADLRMLGVLDTPAEERFDRLTRITQRYFSAPIVLISLIDTYRQWFKSRQGLDATETGRDISFCGHAILQDRIFIVENALHDIRFSDNPLVTGSPGIRFYAGMPLKGPSGYNIGTLCVIDRQPRQFSLLDQAMLQDMAALVETELNAIDLAELRRQRDHEFDLLQAIMESMRSTLSVRDVQGRYLFVNSEYETVHQRQRSDLLGKTAFDLFEPTFAQASHDADRQVIASGATLQSQSTIEQSDGIHTYQVIRTPLFRKNREIYGVCVVSTDITERLLSEKKFRESEELLLSVMNSTDSLIAVRDVHSRFLFVNRRYEELLQISHQSFAGKSLEEVYPADLAERTRFDDLAVLQSGQSSVKEAIFSLPDGDRYFHTVRSPLFDQSRQIYGLCIVATDVTEIRLNEQALRASQDQLKSLNRQLVKSSAFQKAVLDVANFSIIATDTAGVIQLFSAGSENMLGYQANELIGKHTPAILHDPLEILNKSKQSSLELQQVVEPGFDAFVAKVRKGGYDEHEWAYLRKDGSRLPVMLSISALFDEAENVIGFLGIAYDLTAQKRVEKMKNEFVSTVSHELRTPLTSIRGSLGLLTSGKMMHLPPKVKELLEIANANCERLVRLINDILDIEKIESGNMKFDFHSHSMQELIALAVATTRSYADTYQVTYEVLVPDYPLMVLVDSDRVIQVMVNLLSNACKFSRPGNIVTLHLQEVESAIRLSVLDHGTGVPASFRAQIFQKFAQADSSDTRKKGGTGLGLSICKTIIEAHHGKIDFVSDPGVRTEFFFELPRIDLP
ncbi:PAS domain-containing protein [Undibacterium sp. Jales W-56]|uniref:PAS domain-containing protein n=1 Tax=Undibacterium sp. Jales W-56 TaxID=2897325 RepID=UPI0021D39B13|nr:PAS domain-containing protein [Undibacterium sp. Jales W-56]MCU6432945.1 PAS domain-containing protein [Undibacterium sp. Jales W-56]